MSLRIRLRQQGRKNRRFYRIVVTDSRVKRDGKYVETIGWYNPYEEEGERHLHLQADRVGYWVGLGAEMSSNVEALVAKAAPEIVKAKTERLVARRQKAHAKRKARASKE